MVFVASSFARSARAADGCFTFVLIVSPSSTSRRIASDSVGESGCFSAHLVIDARTSGSARKPTRGAEPVRGRPGIFCFTRVVFFIAIF